MTEFIINWGIISWAPFIIGAIPWYGEKMWMKGTVTRPLGYVITTVATVSWYYIWYRIIRSSQPEMTTNLVEFLSYFGIIMTILGGIAVIVAGLRILEVASFNQRESKRLLTNGIYGLVRNPIYSGSILLFIGLALRTRELYAFFLTPILFIQVYVQALLEEKLILEKMFPHEFEAYRNRVPKFYPLPVWIILIGLYLAVGISVIHG